MTVICGGMVAECAASLESLINEITNTKTTLVVQVSKLSSNVMHKNIEDNFF